MTLFLDRVGKAKIKLLDNGMADVQGRVARVGVQVYTKADGTPWRLLRRPEDVFAPAALEGYTLATVTDDHPASGVVTAEDSKDLGVGVIADGRRDGNYVASRLRLTDAKTIKKAMAGKNQLSAGYSATVVEGAGVWTDSAGVSHPYDAIQTNIRINHVALVDQGRAGPEVRLLTDSAGPMICLDGVSYDAESVVPPLTPRKLMEKIILDGATIEVDAPVKLAVESAIAKLAGELDAIKSKLVTTQAALDTANDPTRIGNAVKARVALESQAAKFLTDSMTGLSDRDVRIAALKVMAPGVLCEGKSDEYVSAAFDTAIATAAPVDRAARKLADSVKGTGVAPPDAPKSFAEMAREYSKNFDALK